MQQFIRKARSFCLAFYFAIRPYVSTQLFFLIGNCKAKLCRFFHQPIYQL